MSRMIHEAVNINSTASMNSKAEYGRYKIARITVEQSDYEVKKALDEASRSLRLRNGQCRNLKLRTS